MVVTFKSTLHLYLEKPVYGGACLAKNQETGKVVFVSGGQPQEEVQVHITETKKTYDKAQVEHVLKRAPYDIPSPCPAFRTCGGCQWLSAPYKNQMEWKIQMVKDAFEQKFHPVISSKEPQTTSGYRHRIQLRVHVDEKGHFIYGFFSSQSHTKVPVASCFIASSYINDFLRTLSQMTDLELLGVRFRLEIQELPYFLALHQPALVLLCHLPDPKFQSRMELFLKNLSQSSPHILWAGFPSKKEHKVFPFETDPEHGLLFHTSPGAFQQVHREENFYLRSLIKKWAERVLESSALVWDLYSGSGNLSLTLKATYPDWNILCVEGSKESCLLGQTNSEKNHISISFLNTPVETFLVQEASKKQSIDLVILDPGREGIKPKGIQSLLQLEPKWIFAVSCDLGTGARDLKKLFDQYELEEMVVLDFFPQTFHMETIARLKRKKNL